MENSEEKEDAVEEQEHTMEGGKFLSFFLGKEEYAIAILKVQEIIGLMPITPVPRMPDYIKGVLNLRGKIVPVMNLRIRFGLNEIEYSEETCIIVVQEKQFLMGVIVDKVSEVADIDGNQIEEVPSLGASEQSEYLSGIGKVKEQVKMIIDVERVLFDVPDDVLDNNTKAASAVV